MLSGIFSCTSGKIWKGSDAEIELPVWIPGLSYEEYPDAVAYFFTKDDSETMIEKPISGLPMSGINVLFHFSSSELDTIGNGVLWYKIDYGSVVKEFNTMFYLVTPSTYSAKTYATEEYVDDAIAEALSGVTGETDIVWDLPSTEGVLTGETILDMYFSGYTIDFSGYTFDDFKDALQSDSIFYIDTLGKKWKVQAQEVDASEQRATGVLYTEYFFPLINQMCYSKINLTYYSDAFHYSTKMPVCAMTSTQEMMTYVDTAINNATSGLTKKTTFNAHTADTSIHFTMTDVESEISSYLRTNNYMDFNDVQSAVDAGISQVEQELGNYTTYEYVNSAISASISTISAVTSGTVEDMISSALTPYYTSGETDSAISTATSGLTKKTTFNAHTADTSIHFTMTDVESDISGYLRQNSYAQMSDVNDAVGAAVSQIEYELGSYVKSDTCHTIWTGTQAQYNSMSAHTADTLYIIQD